MKAFRLLDWKTEPELTEVPDPEPGPGQVVIEVGGAGACHSDVHLMHDFEAGVVPWNPPFTLGHENAGWVHRLGEGVSGLEEGQPVAVYGPWGCGKCAMCRIGMETYCENLVEAPVAGGGGGLGLDGGMAEYMLIDDARHLIPLPEGLDPVQAAPLTDAGLTPYHAIRRSLSKLSPRATVVAIGVGGLGQMAVQILRAVTSATIVAVDTRKAALELADQNGADRTFLSDDTTAEKVRELTSGLGADVVLDFVGVDPTLSMAAEMARQLGDITIVGIGGGTLPVSFFSVPYEVSIQTTYWGSRPELAEVLNLAARKLIMPHVTTFSLDEAGAAYEALMAGEIEGRAVVVPT